MALPSVCAASTFVLLAAGSALAPSAWATQYLTIDEAQKVMYPEATAFKEQPLDLNSVQMRDIEKLSGLPARSVHWRVSSAWRGATCRASPTACIRSPASRTTA